ncbi:MAG: SirB2 family protein [Cytophagales bacterium]|nr:SirB2 family protein [Cytophaga sp.]
MEKGFLHLHITVTSLFIFIYLAKVYLLTAEKTEAFNKLRSKTKIADIILGSLIIITGVFLTIKAPMIETYLIVKIVLVIVSIPLGIIAMKKANKVMAIVVLAIYFYVFLVARTNSLTLQKDAFVTPTATLDATTGAVVTDEGKIVFDAKCAICHGSDGKLMLNEAKDLSASTLKKADIIEQTKNGKGLMPGFKDQLNEKQLQAVAEYVESLKK